MDYKYDPQAALFTIFLTVLMVAFFFKGYYSNKLKTNNNYVLVFLLMSLISVFAFTEYDLYHYHTMYDLMVRHKEAEHVEDYYFWLSQVLPNNYYLWRFAIWGGACLLLVFALRIMKLNATIAGAFIPVLLIGRFVVSRASFGLSVLLLSLVLLLLPGKNRYVRMIGLLGIAASLFLHDSMLVFVTIAILSLVLKIKKKIVILSLIAFPFLYVSVMTLSERVLDAYGLVEENRIFSYLEGDALEASLIGQIYDMAKKIPLLLMLYSISNYYLNFNKTSRSKYEMTYFYFYKISYVFIYVSFLFYMQDVSDWISRRVYDAGLFPLLLCLTYYMWKNKRTTFDKVYISAWLFMLFFGEFYFIHDVSR